MVGHSWSSTRGWKTSVLPPPEELRAACQLEKVCALERNATRPTPRLGSVQVWAPHRAMFRVLIQETGREKQLLLCAATFIGVCHTENKFSLYKYLNFCMELCFTVLSINMKLGSGRREDGSVLALLGNRRTTSESYYSRTVLVSLHPDQVLMPLVSSVSATGEHICVFRLLLPEDQHPAISSFAYFGCFRLPTPSDTYFPTIFWEF